jgi:hypothetical protein
MDIPFPVYKYLAPDERMIITIRQHPSLLVPPLAAAVGGLLAAIAVTVTSDGTEIPKLVVWIATTLLILRFIWAVWNWSLQYIVITQRRFILISGIATRKVAYTELPDLKKKTFERSFAGRMLGYGTYKIGPDGADQLVINYIPYPEQITIELDQLFYEISKTEND